MDALGIPGKIVATVCRRKRSPIEVGGLRRTPTDAAKMSRLPSNSIKGSMFQGLCKSGDSSC